MLSETSQLHFFCCLLHFQVDFRQLSNYFFIEAKYAGTWTSVSVEWRPRTLPGHCSKSRYDELVGFRKKPWYRWRRNTFHCSSHYRRDLQISLWGIYKFVKCKENSIQEIEIINILILFFHIKEPVLESLETIINNDSGISTFYSCRALCSNCPWSIRRSSWHLGEFRGTWSQTRTHHGICCTIWSCRCPSRFGGTDHHLPVSCTV